MKRSLVTIVVGLALTAGLAVAAEYPADNSGKNARDRDSRTLTSGNQSNAKGDVHITQAIRKAVVSDKALSTSAHNVKIITVGGHVTLRGPVKSPDEKAKIEAKAIRIAGTGHVENELEVASH
jgi:hyperosmotically inducible protein